MSQTGLHMMQPKSNTNTIKTANQVRLSRQRKTFIALWVLLVLASTYYLSAGAIAVDTGQTFTALWQSFFHQPLSMEQQVITHLRFPRLVFAMLIGAGLAASGVASQGLFRNPLADPAMIGVAAGAALGASVTLVLIGSIGQIAPASLVATGAFIGGLFASFIVWIIGCRSGSVATLLLAGIAINAIVFAAIGLLQYLANDQQLRDLTFWSLGSLSAASWSRIALIAPCILISLYFLHRQTQGLNALLLGESEAAFMGFSVKRIQHLVLIFIALAVSASVAFTGVISFVGLVVPHLLRLILGPDHRPLLPAAALGGALLVVIADCLARTLAIPAELPLGVLISLIGGPFFLWLLLRSRLGQLE